MPVNHVPFDLKAVPSPCFVISEAAVEENLRILATVRERTGCKVLLALKAFAPHALFRMMRQYLDGACCSGPLEARLSAELFGRQTHAYAPAYSDADMTSLLQTADHISFNSLNLWRHFRKAIAENSRTISVGLRINPEYSTAPIPLYDPCAPGSRFGIRAEDLKGEDLNGIEGLHFHALCEQYSSALEPTLAAVEEKFDQWLPQMRWVNFGGGHWITKPDYDVDHLCDLVSAFQEKYGVEVILEPGEAAGLGSGFLVSEVLDVIENNGSIAILDCSATAHFADVIEMPFIPTVAGATPLIGDKECPDDAWEVRLGGLTCLSGDTFGRYAFRAPLKRGDRIAFCDAGHYTMVKTNHFNGVQHPSIAILHKDGQITVQRTFGYEDYKSRLS